MTQDVLDLENLKFLKELLSERFPELVNTYLTDSCARIEALKVALAQGDLPAATHESHGLKGSSRNIGANPLADLCEIMESQARQGEVIDGQQQLAAIEKNIAAVTSELKKLL